MKTVWRPIRRNPAYEISPTGLVRRRLPGKNTRPGRRKTVCIDKDGYKYVSLGHADRGFIHILVCETWHGPRPSPQHYATHRNGNLNWNHHRNLRWATQHQNRLDAVRHCRTGRLGGGRNQVLTRRQVKAIRRIGRKVIRERLALRFGISKPQITAILLGYCWKGIK